MKISQRNRIIGIAIAAVAVIVVLFVVFGNSSSKSLSGQWTKTEGSSKFSYIEFFSDGTYTSNHSNYNGSYTVDGDRLRLSGILVEPLTYTFKISGNTLTFLENGNVIAAFEKVS